MPRGRPPACHGRGRSPSTRPSATAPMVRRWAARGTSRGGPEGRRSGTPCHADRSKPLATVAPIARGTRALQISHSLNDSEGGASPTLRPKHAGNIAPTGACRVRHCACDALSGSLRVDGTRTRCLALFSSRMGAGHRSHRASRGAEPTHGTAPISLEDARFPRDPTCARDARTTLCPRSQKHRAPVWCGRPARISVSILSRAPDHEV